MDNILDNDCIYPMAVSSAGHARLQLKCHLAYLTQVESSRRSFVELRQLPKNKFNSNQTCEINLHVRGVAHGNGQWAAA